MSLSKFGFIFEKKEKEKKSQAENKKKYELKRKRTVVPAWFGEFPGLVHKTSETSPSTSSDDQEGAGKLFCGTCLKYPLLADQSSALYLGCTTFRKQSLQTHWKSVNHTKCASQLAHDERKKQAQTKAGQPPLQGPMDRAISQADAANKAKIMKAFNTAYFVAKHEMPFTSYTRLLTLQQKNGMELSNQYRSDNACRRFIFSIASGLAESHFNQLREARMFSIMFDGSTDCSVSELELIYCRFLVNGSPAQVYFKVISPEHAHADGIFGGICEALDGSEIEGWRDKLVSIGADGASVNLGKNNSVATRFRKLNNYIMPIHCVAHRLELGVLQGIKQNQILDDCMKMLTKLHKHYHYSAKALREFRAVAEVIDDGQTQTLKPVRLQGTRWIPHMGRALSVLLRGYQAIRTHLEHVKEAGQSSAEVQGRATYMVNKLKQYKILRFMHLLLDVLDIVTTVSKAFQADHLTVSDYLDALSTANLQLVQLGQENGPNLTKFFDDTAGGTFKTMPLDGIVADGKPRGNDDAFIKLRQQITSDVQECMNTRLERDQHGTIPVLQALAGLFEPSTWPHDPQQLAVYGTDHLQVVITHFSDLLTRMDFKEDQAKREWTSLKAFVKNRVQAGRRDAGHIRDVWAEIITNDDLADRFENIKMLLEISLVSAMSSSVCERGFSTVKRVKTDWRSCLNTDMLDNLLRISIEGPDYDTFDASKAFDRWFHGGQRRRRMNLDGNASCSSDSD